MTHSVPCLTPNLQTDLRLLILHISAVTKIVRGYGHTLCCAIQVNDQVLKRWQVYLLVLQSQDNAANETARKASSLLFLVFVTTPLLRQQLSQAVTLEPSMLLQQSARCKV